MRDITARLHDATLDKDNMPRMDSETWVPCGLAREAETEIDSLRLTIQGHEEQNKIARAEIERLRAALGPLLDAHWPLVETCDHEDENCRRAREALGIIRETFVT